MKHEELTLEKKCREAARRNGWAALKLEKNGNKGVPDDLFLHPDGRARLIEFKKDEKQKPRPAQVVWLHRFSKIAHLCSSYEEFCEVLGLPQE